MSGAAVLFSLTALLTFVWGVIDGTRGAAARAAVTWTVALLGAVLGAGLRVLAQTVG